MDIEEYGHDNQEKLKALKNFYEEQFSVEFLAFTSLTSKCLDSEQHPFVDIAHWVEGLMDTREDLLNQTVGTVVSESMHLWDKIYENTLKASSNYSYLQCFTHVFH